jgi:hypothetical protein
VPASEARAQTAYNNALTLFADRLLCRLKSNNLNKCYTSEVNCYTPSPGASTAKEKGSGVRFRCVVSAERYRTDEADVFENGSSER